MKRIVVLILMTLTLVGCTVKEPVVEAPTQTIAPIEQEIEDLYPESMYLAHTINARVAIATARSALAVLDISPYEDDWESKVRAQLEIIRSESQSIIDYEEIPRRFGDVYETDKQEALQRIDYVNEQLERLSNIK